MKSRTKYDMNFKQEAVKLATEIGVAAAVNELAINKNTLYAWVRAFKDGKLDIPDLARTPKESRSLAKQLAAAEAAIAAKDKEIKRLTRINEILKEATSFFAASRLKLASD